MFFIGLVIGACIGAVVMWCCCINSEGAKNGD